MNTIFLALNLICQNASADPITLFEASCKGDDTAVRSQINAGVKVDAASINCALKNGKFSTANILIDIGHFDVNSSTSSSQTTLLIDQITQLDSVKYLLAKGADPNRADIYLQTPLYHAIGEISEIGLAYSVSEALLSSGANPNTGSVDHESPIYVSIEKSFGEGLKSFSITALLVKYGADVIHSTRPQGMSLIESLTLARPIWGFKPSELDRLIEVLFNSPQIDVSNANIADFFRLESVPISKSAVLRLIEHKIDLAPASDKIWKEWKDITPLMRLAQRTGEWGWSEQLLEELSLVLTSHGVNINALDSYGCSVISYVTGSDASALEYLKFLLKNGLQIKSGVNCVDFVYEPGVYVSPLMHFAIYPRPTVFKFLVSQGYDPKEDLENGKTALHLVTRFFSDGDLDFVKYLVESVGIDINKKDNLGNSAYCNATYLNRSPQTAKYLASRGANTRCD